MPYKARFAGAKAPTILFWLSLLTLRISEADWAPATATLYDGSPAWKEVVAPRNYGDLYGGACGYQNRPASSNDDFDFAWDAVAAISDTALAPDGTELYPGSCGGCYEVRCVAGPVESEAGSGEYWQPVADKAGGLTQAYQPTFISEPFVDELGRSWPGDGSGYSSLNNSALLPDKFTSYCWASLGSDDVIKTPGEAAPFSVQVRITDACPCFYEGNRQEICCTKTPHFDLSYYAFDKIAHPEYGIISVEYRPVDCDSGAPIDGPRPPISPNLYDGGIGAGWGWNPYKATAMLNQPGAGVDGNRNATCMVLSPGGNVAFGSREAYKEGFQPFKDATALRIVLRPTGPAPDYGTPDDNAVAAVPTLLLSASSITDNDADGNEAQVYCDSKATLGDYKQSSKASTDGGADWSTFVVPFSALECQDAALVTDVELEYPGDASDNANFCIDTLSIEKGASDLPT